MRITQQNQAQRRGRMLHAAYELFCEYGIDAVTMAKVAEKSGVSTKSVARYFGSKAELVQCAQTVLWQEITTQILSTSETQLARAKTGFAEVEILLWNFKKLYENHSNYLLFACDYKLYLVRQGIKLPEAYYNEMMGPIIKTFTASFQKGRRDGSISKTGSAAEQVITLWGVMRGFVEEIVVYDKMYEGENPWKKQFDWVVKYSLRAIEKKEGGGE